MEPPRSAQRRTEARLVWAYVRRDQARGVGPAFPAVLADGHAALVERDGVLRPAAAFPDHPAHPYDLVGISGYAALPPRSRPPVFCPVCRERVWLKLGSRLRHHYAHAATSACAVARGEGALHHAAKLHLAAELGRRVPLRVARICHGAATDPRGTPCRAVGGADWSDGWDEVRVERSLPSLRADLLLLRGGEPVGAIEVYATNEVGEERARKYRALGIAWLEVPAAAVVGPHGRTWTADHPLPVIGDGRLHPTQWRCPHHQRLHEAWLEQERSGVHRFAGRFLHLYRTDGGLTAGELRVERVPLSMIERRENGGMAEAWLEREDTGTRIGAAVTTRDPRVARERLHAEFLRWARWTRAERGAVVDSPMRWLPADQLPARDLDRLFPRRLRWDPNARAWTPPPNLPALAWPAIAEGRQEHAPHPVLGHRPCYWTVLPVPGKPPLLHALVDECWVTLRHQTWDWEGEHATRADLEVYFHDGAGWERLSGGPHALTVSLRAEEPPPSWPDLLPAIAARIAAAIEELRAGRERVENLVLPLLAP